MSHDSIALSFGRLAHLLWIRHQLSSRDRWTREQLLRHQAMALSNLRAHAYANSPFYQRFHAGRFDRPLQQLPVLTKKNLMENWNEVTTDRGLRLDELREFIESSDVPGFSAINTSPRRLPGAPA